MLGEFELIERYFRPLAARSPSALDLRDDAAVLADLEGRSVVLTVDAIVAGVHFPESETPELIARRALRVNLSDLAAMGARPEGYLLTAALSEHEDEAWVAAFCRGLEEDQAAFDISLIGGDTVRTPGPLTLSVTAVGSVPPGRELRRGGAGAGDDVWVSGTIGDATLGLRVVQGGLSDVDSEAARFLEARFRLPEPRLALGRALSDGGLATAAADVSDGLIADLGHICTASGSGAEIEAAAVPLSPATARAVDRSSSLLITALTGGDDYELVFTAPAASRPRLSKLASALGLPLTRIGRIDGRPGVRVHGDDGSLLDIGRAGYGHF